MIGWKWDKDQYEIQKNESILATSQEIDLLAQARDDLDQHIAGYKSSKYHASTGSYNTVLGHTSKYHASTGFQNTSIGVSAGCATSSYSSMGLIYYFYDYDCLSDEDGICVEKHKRFWSSDSIKIKKVYDLDVPIEISPKIFFELKNINGPKGSHASIICLKCGRTISDMYEQLLEDNGRINVGCNCVTISEDEFKSLSSLIAIDISEQRFTTTMTS